MTPAAVREAAERIKRHVRRTPVETSGSLDAFAGTRLFFKCENLQRGGAFKIRGAMNAVWSLSEEELRLGVATHSSGNHAQALAIAAASRGASASVVMPENSPHSKREATIARGARVIACGASLIEREKALEGLVSATRARVVHPYDDEFVIAGQGTAALELFGQTDALDVVVVPVGGGGLASGSCLAARACGTAAVIGAEPELADDAARSIQTGELLGPRPPLSVADGLRTALCERTFSVLRRELEGIVLVSEAEILMAMRLLWERMKLIVEPSGAVAFAAVLKNRERFSGKQVGIILSGGNVDLDSKNLGRLFF